MGVCEKTGKLMSLGVVGVGQGEGRDGDRELGQGWRQRT